MPSRLVNCRTTVVGFFCPLYLFVVFFFLSTGSLQAAESQAKSNGFAKFSEPDTLFGQGPPFVPFKNDYALEGGLMSARDDILWIGAMYGTHLGHCLFTQTETCQQYIDAIVGAALREGETQGHLWASPRWQYVNFPKRYSPFWRLIAGVANVARPEARGMAAVGGAGLGVTNYLHDKVDLHLEGRLVWLDRAYYQVVMGVNIKTDRLLEYFAVRLKDLGVGTVSTAIDATGATIEATGEGLGGLIKKVLQPSEDKSQPDPNSEGATQK